MIKRTIGEILKAKFTGVISRVLLFLMGAFCGILFYWLVLGIWHWNAGWLDWRGLILLALGILFSLALMWHGKYYTKIESNKDRK